MREVPISATGHEGTGPGRTTATTTESQAWLADRKGPLRRLGRSGIRLSELTKCFNVPQRCSVKSDHTASPSQAGKRSNLPPSPERKGLTWREFLARHADVLLCADLFTKEIRTFCGLRRAFVLVVMHLSSRTILLARATCSPHAGWMAQQARNTLMVCYHRSAA